MKDNMIDTPTPRTDDLDDKMEDLSPNAEKDYVLMMSHSRNLERELTAAREEVENLRHEYHGAKAMAEGFKDKIKTVTEQRDRLADKFLNLFNAVKYGNFSNGEWDHGAYDEALQSLNQPERWVKKNKE